MAESVRGVSALQSEIEKAKESLKDVDENIKKLTGRDPTIQRTGQRRVSLGTTEPAGRGVAPARAPGGENRLFNLARRGIIQDGGPSGNTPRRGAFARLGPRPGGGGRGRPRGAQGHDSGDEDDLPHRPTLQSSVVATPKEERSRQKSIDEQSRDRKGQARNRRMFGLLLGTLQKFKDESQVTKEKEEQRVQIEKKLEEKFKQEKEEILQERRQLYNERRKKQLTIKLLEQKMEMVKNHDNWEKETRKLENFIRTKARPHIFFMPKILSSDTDSKLHETKKVVDDMVEQRRKRLEQEISEMMSQVDGGPKEDDDGDASMGEEDGESDRGHSSDEDHRTGPAAGKHGDDKENESRERHASEGDEVMEERRKRDREREQRDRDRQEREGRRRERDGGDREVKDGVGERRERSGGRDKDHKDRGRDHEKQKEHRRDKSGDGDSRSRERDHHRSGKGRPDKRGRDSGDERSHGHSSKSKRRSKDGKVERKEKVWEPMEDEEEEEFVGSKGEQKESVGGSDIASKMLAMAGMAGVTREDVMEDESDERDRARVVTGSNSADRPGQTQDDNSLEGGFTQHGDAETKVDDDH